MRTRSLDRLPVPHAGRFRVVHCCDARAHPLVRIQALGDFVVHQGNALVLAGEWGSRKARDLVKILVCKRGRPATRDVLIEALWPEQDPTRTSNRFSVALSTARSVLDPEHRLDPNAFIRADRYTVRLERANLDVDVERFLGDAHTGLALYHDGRGEESVAALELAEASYTGDLLEEDRYEDWAVCLREEARAAYIAVSSALAELAEAERDYRTAVRYRLRALERDGYDEHAHLGLAAGLAAAGQHGCAQWAYGRYVERMTEVGVEPAPYPGSFESGFKATLRERRDHALDERAMKGAW